MGPAISTLEVSLLRMVHPSLWKIVGARAALRLSACERRFTFSEATAGIEPAMKVLQTSRPFIAQAFENFRKFKKVALPTYYPGCADLCGSPHLLTFITARPL